MADAIVDLMNTTRHTLRVLTRDLEPELLDTPEATERLKQILIGSRIAQVNVMVVDTQRARSDGHGWVRLAQRLSSRMAFRVPRPDEPGIVSALMVGDDAHWMRRPFGDRYEGEFALHDRHGAREHIKWFDQAWEFADPAVELARLSF